MSEKIRANLLHTALNQVYFSNAAGFGLGDVVADLSDEIDAITSGEVTGINSITGAVTIVAGSGISVTPSGQNITIDASGVGGGIAIHDITGSVTLTGSVNAVYVDTTAIG